ncbi:iron-sulfur cluster co-chaperone protein HscB homolog isoform X1 [Phoenix dactylifera]|uniref:Iron-sulfur cluster co-chaperone protein HscB homolog isoform X1 n=1 Tax=Phoenix dactylifera TaxID=42345 RepID=A0A8B7BY63_PHODC|nr:iron-sulfur cluster co-chaperone protein HscB homolog isoform X1 [Phoenix dactylifera]
MSSWRKLSVSGLSLLCRRSRLPPNLHLGSHLSRLHKCYFPPHFVSCSGHHRLFPESRVFGRFSCSSESGNGRCWNCGTAAALAEPFLSCRACGSVQPVDQSVDYFQIFGLEKGYDIPDGNLEGKYKDWQKKLHPDLVHSKSEKEKTFAADQSARVNDAYRTLNKSLSRALYLMRLEGVHVDEEKTVMDPDLLAEMMDIREAVEEASDSHALKQLQTQIERKFEAWANSFREAFKRKNFDDAINSIQRMRYYDRAIEEIIKKL